MDNLSIAAPALLGTTTIPIFNGSYAPNASPAGIRASGLPFAQGMIIPARAPSFIFSTFWDSAWSLQQTLKVKVHANCELYLRDTGTNGEALGTGTKYSIATGAQAFAHITDFGEGQGGLIVANMEVFILASNGHDRLSDIITKDAGATIPALPTEPAYHVHGPLSVGGTSLPGVTSVGYQSGNRIIANAPIDGETYPKALIYDGGERSFTVGMERPVAALDAVGLEGGEVESVTIDIREI